ncbi:MAG: hypothetical protein M5R40_11700 [Anaerolineae bacterium]|nr:hypothetical protein [Anaerolineae bacterium]
MVTKRARCDASAGPRQGERLVGAVEVQVLVVNADFEIAVGPIGVNWRLGVEVGRGHPETRQRRRDVVQRRVVRLDVRRDQPVLRRQPALVDQVAHEPVMAHLVRRFVDRVHEAIGKRERQVAHQDRHERGVRPHGPNETTGKRTARHALCWRVHSGTSSAPTITISRPSSVA